MRDRVLVLLHGDGFVSVRATGDIDVRIERVPYVPKRDVDGEEYLGIEGEIAAEDYLSVTLPAVWRELLQPVYEEATEIGQPLRVAEILNREADQIDLALIDVMAVSAAIQKKDEAHKVWTL